MVADLFGAELLEEAGVEVARVVHQDVDPAKLPDGGLDRGLGVLGVVDIELDGQQVTVVADRRRDLRRVAAGGDDGVAGGQGGLGDVNAQATACAGDEPNLPVGHWMFLVTCESQINPHQARGQTLCDWSVIFGRAPRYGRHTVGSTSRMCFSDIRPPCTVILVKAASISRRFAGVSCKSMAPRFSVR